MARARNIKPSLFKNELLGEADPFLTLLFISLWTLADREGRLEDRPLRIKAETFPYRELPLFNGYLTELERLGFIHRFSVGKKNIIQIVNFRKHQSPHRTEKSSELPANPIPEPLTVKAPLNNGCLTEQERPDSLIPDSLIPDSLTPDSETKSKSKDMSPLSAETEPIKSKITPKIRGSTLPADWFLPPEWGEWALSEKPEWSIDDVKKVSEKFKDHWLANANQRNGKKSDWLAAWRNWVRKESDFCNSKNQKFDGLTFINEERKARLRNEKIIDL